MVSFAAVSGIFGALPNTSFSQNVGLIAMTGVMSRHVVTIGAVFLILCGLPEGLWAVAFWVLMVFCFIAPLITVALVLADGVCKLARRGQNIEMMI